MLLVSQVYESQLKTLNPSSFSRVNETRCGKTAWYGLLVFVICTLLAHAMLTIRLRTPPGVQQLQVKCYHRMYVVTGKNVLATAGFIVITACQLVLGVWMVTLAVMKGGKSKPLNQRNYPDLTHLFAPLFRLRSPTAATGAPRRIPPLCVCST